MKYLVITINVFKGMQLIDTICKSIEHDKLTVENQHGEIFDMLKEKEEMLNKIYTGNKRIRCRLAGISEITLNKK